MKRYVQLSILVIAGGAIYPLVYLRQNFELSILDAFGITISELSDCYALLGVIFVATYLPSGWLTDRVSPRTLIAFSLAGAGATGLWFATFPELASLRVIFMLWGITTGLTFWSALIKAVAVLGEAHEQGRFFGVLEGGRGLVEAALASVALAIFALYLEDKAGDLQVPLRRVIYFYVGAMLTTAPIVFFALRDNHNADSTTRSLPRGAWQDFLHLFAKRQLWLAAFCILCGYQLFWASYSFSAYLQQVHGMTAVTVGIITVARLWTRPLGALASGWLGDALQRERVLAALLVSASLSLAGVLLLPAGAGIPLTLSIVLLTGLLTFGVRGIYWATLETCDVPARSKGLAIGVISLIAYLPDIYLPLINGALLTRFPGNTGYAIYFSGLALFGLLGATAAWRLSTNNANVRR